MDETRIREMNEQLERIGVPAQRMGALMLNNAERLADLQFGLLRSYTHFMMSQWRDVLEVRDAQSLQEFLQKQGRAAQELGQKLTEDSRQIMSIGQDFAEQAGRVAQRNVESLSEAARTAAAGAGQQAERSARAAQSGARRAQ